MNAPSASRPDTNDDTEVRRPGRPRDARVDLAVVEAALFELIENGYAGLSMDKVATRAGVSKASIYRRWASREDLILHAWRSMGPHKDHTIDTGSLRGDLYAMVDQYACDLGENHMKSLLPQLVAAVHQSPRLKELFNAFVHEQLEPLRIIYQRAQDRGEVRADVNIDIAHKLVTSTVFFSLLMEGELLPPDDLRTSVDLVLHGIVDPTYTPRS